MASIVPSERLRRELAEIVAGVGDEDDPIEAIGRLGARLILQQALEEELSEFLGREREGFQNLGSWSSRRRWSALRASPDAPFLRLPLVLGCSAAACRTPAERVRKRRRVARVAASARGVSPADEPPLAPARRPCLPGGASASAPAMAPTRAARDAADAPALASGARSTQVGAAATKTRPSACRPSAAPARAPPRARKPALGLCADRGRAAEARLTGVAEHRQALAPCRRSRAGAAPLRPEPAGLLAPAGRERDRLRFSSLSRRSRFGASTCCSSCAQRWRWLMG
jgi:hypothetical protein